MIAVTVQGVFTAQKYLDALDQAINPATARALNRSIRFGYTRTARGITSETGLQRKYIVPSLEIRRATYSRLDALLAAKTRRVPLIAYFRTGFRSGRGIGRRQYAVGVAPAGAFMAQFRSGKRVVAERIGKKRGELRVLTGPPIPQVVLERHIFEAIKGPVIEHFDARLAHELSRAVESKPPEPESA